MKLFLFISAQKVSSQRLPSQTVVNIGPAAGDPGLSTHPLSLVKVSHVLCPANFEVWKAKLKVTNKKESSEVQS